MGPAWAGRVDGTARLDLGRIFAIGIRYAGHMDDLSGRVAAYIGAGMSMGFHEAASDEWRKLSGLRDRDQTRLWPRGS